MFYVETKKRGAERQSVRCSSIMWREKKSMNMEQAGSGNKRAANIIFLNITF